MFGFFQFRGRKTRAPNRSRTKKRRPLFERLEDRFALAVSIASDSATGILANDNSYAGSLSADGRYLAFYSYANNLVANDTNATLDVFVKDLQTGNIVRANTSSTGEQALAGTSGGVHYFNPVLSDDGKLVAFYLPYASNLIPGGSNEGDIFVKNLVTGEIQRVNQDSSGNRVACGGDITFSGNGRYVAYSLGSIFVKDLQTGTLTNLSPNTASGSSYPHFNPQLSADGQQIAFYTDFNYLPEDTNNKYDIYIKNLTTGAYQRVKADYTFTTTNQVFHTRFSMSSDARYVAFPSYATDLVTNNTSGILNIFVTDVVTGITKKVNTTETGVVSDADAQFPVISDDGRFVSFVSNATNLAKDLEQKNVKRVFIKDLQTGYVRLAATTPYNDPNPSMQQRWEIYPTMSGDGRLIAFQSNSPAHVANDTNGYQDIFLVEQDPAPPFLQIDYAVSSQPASLTQGDFNGDGRIDFAISYDDGRSVSIMLAKASGGFSLGSSYTVGPRALSVATADFDEDGDLDLAVASYGDNNIAVLYGNGNGTFGGLRTFDVGPGTGPHFVTVADFNRDGDLDLGVATHTSGQLVILQGHGNGTFNVTGSYASGMNSVYVVNDDWNGDNIIDLAVVNGGDDTLSVFIGNGDGTFAPRLVLNVGDVPYSVATADFNKDGRRDLVVANRVTQSVSVFLGNGDGTFQSQQTYAAGDGATSVAVADFDGDGNSDLIVASITTSSLKLLMGNGDGTFQPAVSLTADGRQSAIVTGDYNGDGKIDFATTLSYNNQVTVYYNSLTAPTTSEIANQIIDLRSIQNPYRTSVDIPLWPAFADAEDSDSQLTYSIARETQPGYFNYVINPATGVLRASLISTSSFNITNVTVRATDPVGAFVETTFQLSVFLDDTPTAPPPTVSGPADLGSFLQNAGTSALNYAISVRNNATGNANYFDITSSSSYSLANPTLTIPGGGTGSTTLSLLPPATATNGGKTGTVGYASQGTGAGYHNFTYNVGNATLPAYPGYGPALTANTPINGTTYLNLSSNTLDKTLHLGTSNGNAVGTTATILSYENLTGSDTTVNMAWQARRNGPMLRWGNSPGSPSSTNVNLVSDTVMIDGLYNTAGVYRFTDAFVIQMSYSEALLNGLESTYVANRQLSLVSFNEYLYNSPEQYYGWGKTIEGNSSGTETYYQSSWAAAGSPLTVGSWGVDAVNNVVWAVVNHGAEFGVATMTSTVTPPVNTPPTVVNPPSVVVTTINGPTSTIELVPIFTDAEDGPNGLTYSVPSNSSNAIVTLDATNKQLHLNFNSVSPGYGYVAIRATDSQGLYVDTMFSVVVNAPRLDFTYFTSTVLEDSGLSSIAGTLSNYSAGPLPSTTVTTDRPELFAVQPSIVYDASNVPSLSFQPAANAFGEARVFLTQQYDSSTQLFEITITPVNDAPSFVAGSPVTVNQDSGSFAAAWVASASTGPGNEASQALTYLVTTDHPELFAVAPAISPAGELTFTPAAGASGIATVSVQVRDNGGTENGGIDQAPPQTMTITITPLAPAVLEVSVLEDSGYYFENTSTFYTGPGQVFSTEVTATITSGDTDLFATAPRIIPNSSGVWYLEFTPRANANGLALLHVVSKDDAGQTLGVYEFLLEVTPVNDAPSFVAGPPVTVIQNSGHYEAAWVESSSRGPANEAAQTLSYIVTTDRPDLFTVLPAISPTGQLTFTPANGRYGVANVSVTVRDSGGTANGGSNESLPSSLTITIDQPPPVFIPGGNITVAEDSGAYASAWGNYYGNNNPYTAFVVSAADPSLFLEVPKLTRGPNPGDPWILTFTPAANAYGTTLVRVQEDLFGMPVGLAHEFELTITPVNDAPSFVKGPDIWVLKNSGVYTAAWVDSSTAGPSNEAAQGLAYVVSTNRPDLFAAEPTISPTGQLIFTPAANAVGIATVTVRVRDSGGTADGGVDESASSTFMITIYEEIIIGPVVFTPGGNVTVTEDSGAYSSAWGSYPGNTNSYTTFALTADDPSLFLEQPRLTRQSPTDPWILTFTPAADAHGSTIVRVQELASGYNAGPVHSFTLTVTPVNDAPSFVAGPDVTAAINSGMNSTAWVVSASPGPSNESSQGLTYLVDTDRPELFTDTPAISPTGQLTFSVAPYAVGTANVTVRVRDNGGTANGGVDESASSVFKIYIVPTDPLPPVFTPGGNVTVNEDSGAFATAWGSYPGNTNSSTTFALTADDPSLFLVQPQLTRETPTDPWILTFTPAANANGTTIVRVQELFYVYNAGAAREFTLAITPVNDAPSFVAGPQVTVNENSGAYAAAWVSSSSTGPSNESSQTLNYLVTADRPELFAVAPAISPTGQLTFTPAQGASGVATVTLRARDNGGTANGGVDESLPVVLTITILQDDVPPVFVPGGSVTVNEDSGAYNAAWGSYPGNTSPYTTFTLTAADPSLFLVQPQLTRVTPTDPWLLTFTPAANAHGTTIVRVQEFIYGDLIGPSREFSLTIQPVNDAPSFVAGPAVTVNQDSGAYTAAWVASSSTGPSNESSQTLNYILITDRPDLFAETSAISPTGQLTFTPAQGKSGVATITVRARDNGGTDNGGVNESLPGTMTITIVALPQPVLGPTITDVKFYDSTNTATVPYLTPISAIVVTFNRSMSDTGDGGVRNRNNWQLTKDGQSIASKIASMQFVNEPGQVTQLQFIFTEPLGPGNFLLVASPAITDAQGIAFQQGYAQRSVAGYEIPFRIGTVTTTDKPDENPDKPQPPIITTTIKSPGVTLVTFVSPVTLSPRIQAAGETKPQEKEVEPPNAPEPLPTVIPGILRLDHSAAVALQPELALTGYGTTFVINTIPDLATNEDPDEFLPRDQTVEQLGSIQRPQNASLPETQAAFSWWWLGLGVGSLLCGLGHYTWQRRLATRNKPLTNDTSPETLETVHSPLAPE
jgi:cyanate lyase